MATATKSPRKPKAVDPLESLLNDATPLAPKKPGAKKKQRDLIELTEQEALTFNRFCMADAAMKMAKGHQESSKGTILPVLKDKLLNIWCEEGHRTDNPRVQTENGQAILQARESLRFELPVGDNGEPGTVIDALMSAGFSEDEAEAIREKEFTETTELRFANITKLRDDADTKKIVDKLLKLVLDEFSPNERAVLLEKVNAVTLNEGFLDRAVTHANCEPIKLKALLDVVRPTFLMSQIVWKGELNDAVKSLEAAAATPAPALAPSIPTPTTAIPKVFNSDDKQWRASYIGGEAKLFMVGADSDVLVATKNCSGGPSHAEQTCKKWMREPNYRAESMKAK